MAAHDFSRRRAAARKAALTRSQVPGSLILVDAERELKEARLADQIRRTVESAPPLTSAQRDRLARLLMAGAA